MKNSTTKNLLKQLSVMSAMFAATIAVFTGCSIGNASDKVSDASQQACDLYDNYETKDDLYQNNEIIKISSLEREIEVDFDGDNLSGVRNTNDYQYETYGDLLLDAEYISGGGPRPPEINFYLKRMSDGWYNLKINSEIINIRLATDTVYGYDFGFWPSDYVDDCSYVLSFNLNGDIRVTGDNTEATFGWEYTNPKIDWIYISKLSVGTSISNCGEYFEFESGLSGDIEINLKVNDTSNYGLITLEKGTKYRIYISDFHITDEDGNTVEMH